MSFLSKEGVIGYLASDEGTIDRLEKELGQTKKKLKIALEFINNTATYAGSCMDDYLHGKCADILTQIEKVGK